MKIKFFYLLLTVSFPLYTKLNISEDYIVAKTSNNTVFIRDYNAWEQCGLMHKNYVEIMDSVIKITQINTARFMTTCHSYHNFVTPIVN